MGYINEFEDYSCIGDSRFVQSTTVESRDGKHSRHKVLAKTAKIFIGFAIGVAAMAAIVEVALSTLRGRTANKNLQR